MPSQKPRVALTLDDDLKNVIADLSDLTGKPQARIITDFLKETYPALVALRDALQDVKEKKNAIPHLAKMASYVNEQSAIVNSSMSDFYSKVGKDD